MEEPTLLGEHQGQPQRIRGIQQPPLDIEWEERIGIPGPDALIEANGNEVNEQHLRQPRIQCINCERRNHVVYECPERCQFRGNSQH